MSKQTKRSTKKAHDPAAEGGIRTLIGRLVSALFLTLCVGICLLLLTTAILSKTADPGRAIPIAGICCACLTALLGGGLVARLCRGRAPLLLGLLFGVLLLALFAIAALLTQRLRGAGTLHPGVLALLPLTGAGTLFGARRPRKKTRRH